MPTNSPEDRLTPVQKNVFVDSDHAGYRATQRSHTAINLFLNMFPIIWYPKKKILSVFFIQYSSVYGALNLLYADDVGGPNQLRS